MSQRKNKQTDFELKQQLDEIDNAYFEKINQLDEVVGSGVEIPDVRVSEHNEYADQLLETISKVYDMASELIHTCYRLRLHGLIKQMKKDSIQNLNLTPSYIEPHIVEYGQIRSYYGDHPPCPHCNKPIPSGESYGYGHSQSTGFSSSIAKIKSS